MRPITLELENFGSYIGQTEVDLSDMRMVAVTGDNGAGKSTMLDAIIYAITGSTRAGAEADSVINDAASSASVQLTFQMGSQTWRVKRTRVRGKRTVAVLEAFDEAQGAWAPVGAEGVKGVEAALDEILGLSSEALLSTAFCTQGDSARFSSATPKRRKEILAELLGLDRYASWAVTARNLARSAAAKAAALTETIAEMDAAIAERGGIEAQLAQAVAELGQSESDVAKLTEQIEKIEQTARAIERIDADIAARLGAQADKERVYTSAVDRAKADLEQAVERLSRAQAALSAVQSKANALDNEIKAAEDAESALASLRAKRDFMRDAGHEERRKLDHWELLENQYSGTVAETTARLESLGHADGNVCWTCGQPLDKAALQALKNGLETTLGEARSNLAEASTAASKARAKRGELLERYKALKDKVAAQESACKAAADTVSEARSAASRAEEVGRQIALYSSDVETAKKRLDSLGPAPAPDEAIGRLRADRDRLAKKIGDGPEPLKARRQALTGTVRDLERAIGALEEKLTARDDLASKKEEKLKQLEIARADESAGALCAEAFGPDGIPNMIFAQQASYLEAIASEVLGALSEGRMTLELRTTRTRSDGGEIGALDVLVTLDNIQRPYAAFSGGERLRIDLALRVALAQLLARRRDARIGMLAIDEGWGALDKSGVAGAAGALRALSEHFELVLTITHQEEVADAFDSRLEVRREPGGGSVIERVA